MLWSLIASAYVIYLYRKQRAEGITVPVAVQTDAISAALADLDGRIEALERRVGSDARETRP